MAAAANQHLKYPVQGADAISYRNLKPPVRLRNPSGGPFETAADDAVLEGSQRLPGDASRAHKPLSRFKPHKLINDRAYIRLMY